MNVQEQKSSGRPRGRRATAAGKSAGGSDIAVIGTAAIDAAADIDRQSMVAVAAYFRAEKRGFEPGYELEDWLAAESEISGRVASIVSALQLAELGSAS